MKAIIEIEDKQGCINCPYCHYKDNYDNYRSENSGNGEIIEGFYCRKSNKFITTFYNTPEGNGIVIPDWCKLNFMK